MTTTATEMNRMTWTVCHRGQIVGRHASEDAAHRACRNDLGRTLMVHDPIGRIRSRWLDGHNLDKD